MVVDLEPLQALSLKQECVRKLERLILSGSLRVGERLPPERQLAQMLEISRPVVHEALVDLAAKGLVTIVPRRGAHINDFRTSGSCAMLTSLLAYNEGELDAQFLHSMSDLRVLIETETARLAARHRTSEQLDQLMALAERERAMVPRDMRALSELDFELHLVVALSSTNLMYPLILNSFKPVYSNITRLFFSRDGSTRAARVVEFHGQLIAAIGDRDEEGARNTMAAALEYASRGLQDQWTPP